jgi:hypothetical protein
MCYETRVIKLHSLGGGDKKVKNEVARKHPVPVADGRARDYRSENVMRTSLSHVV